MDLVNELLHKRTQLRPALEKLRKAGHDLAKAEYDYKRALRKDVLIERAKETAVGVIDKITYGEDTVSMLRLRRGIALTDYEMYKEIILLLKLEIRVLDNQIAREWSTSDS